MRAIETTATMEDASHLRLEQPLPVGVRTTLRLIVLLEDESGSAKAPDFEAAFGSYYREHPDEVRRSSDDWMRELREGEEI